jgi:hypothetical protein
MDANRASDEVDITHPCRRQCEEVDAIAVDAIWLIATLSTKSEWVAHLERLRRTNKGKWSRAQCQCLGFLFSTTDFLGENL